MSGWGKEREVITAFTPPVSKAHSYLEKLGSNCSFSFSKFSHLHRSTHIPLKKTKALVIYLQHLVLFCRAYVTRFKENKER